LFGFLVGFAFLSSDRIAYGQADSVLVQNLEGRTLTAGQPEWDAVHKYVIASFPGNKQYAKFGGEYHIWRIRSEDLVFQANNPGSADGFSTAGFFWFDLHGAPLASYGFFTGHRTSYNNCSVVSVPGVSGYVIETILTSPVSKAIQEDFALNVYQPLLIRYGGTDGTLLQNSYDIPNFACGPMPGPYGRQDILEVLGGSNPLMQLQALTWLSGSHSTLTTDIVDVYHERIEDSVRYWSLSNDSTISQAAAALASSGTEWVAKAAKFYVKVSKPQSVPSINLTPRAKNLVVTDLRVGKGGDFDGPDREVKVGDRVVIEYEIKLTTGAIAFSNLNSTDNPPVFAVGSKQVIDGLSQGMIGMKVGGLRTIEIPAAMAYGDAGADTVPPGADLTYTVKLLHIATEVRFGMGTEKVLRMHDLTTGVGAPARPGDTVNVSCGIYRLDGKEIKIPEISGAHQMVLFTGSLIKKAIIGMKAGGLRRLLISSPTIFGLEHVWFHYGAQVLEIKLESIVSKH